MTLTVGSLFAGIGGIELGLERTGGFRTVWQVEIDDYARRVLAKHWPDVARWDDVRTFPPPGEWGVDLICGGFPCQDISFAGKGAGLAGERSGLWSEFARIIRTLRPRYVLVENVPALLIRGMDAVLGELAALGYDAEWGCIPAAAFGAPHIRERLFIVADNAKIRCSRHCQQNTRIAGHPQRWLCELERGDRWLPEPGMGRVVHGVPSRMDRNRIAALGNAVVPQVAEWIGRRILAALETQP